METWKTWKHGNMETWRHRQRRRDVGTRGHGDIKWKTEPRRFLLIRLPFAHHANGSLLFVRLLTNGKETHGSCKRTKWTCTSIPITERLSDVLP
jgi:hypothetical protein